MPSTKMMDANDFNALPRIDEINPMDAGDEVCFQELRDVLKRHGKLNRFGVMLLHKHFDLNPGEMFVEYTNEMERTQTVRVINADDASPCGVTTAWKLTDGSTMIECYPGVCTYRDGEHHRSHTTQPAF